MLKNLVECRQETNFLILEDREDVICQDLFVAFLANCASSDSIKQINLICYENPPSFYLPGKALQNGKITPYNYFADPCSWNNASVSKTDLSFFTSDPKKLSETAFFIDSVSLLTHYHGFCTTYRNLSFLKKCSKKIVCLVHEDLFSSEQLEEIYFLATACIKLLGFVNKNSCEEKVCEVTYSKPSGKLIKQKEIFSISDDLKIISRVRDIKASVSSAVKRDIESLTTFNLGLQMSKEERKAKDELILPYLKRGEQSKMGEIIYQTEVDDLEDDPDDDLDI